MYDANMLLRNSTERSFGGMLTFLTVGSSTPPPPTDTGPTISALGLSPNPTNGSVDVSVSATVTDGGSTATPISRAEFYIDSTANIPIVCPHWMVYLTLLSEAVVGTIPVATLSTLASGNHTIYVRGQDSASPTANWGPFLSITLKPG